MAASQTVADTLLAELPKIRDEQEEFYRDLHRHPELSRQEVETARKVADRLRGLGYETHDGVGGTGVVGVLANGPGPTVLLRADMDALPVQEATGLEYASTVRATDADGNDVPVMHACGHDVHVVALLGAARLLAEGRGHWSGTVVALFQPAEETSDGARAMVDDGLVELLPKVDVALAQHVLPAPAGHVGVRAGAVLSAADSMRVTVYGRGAHGSMPQAAVDPVVLAAMIVVRLQTVVAREVAPGESAVLTVGSIQAGAKSNVIPDRAVLQLNIRTYSEHTRTAVLGAIRRIVVAECQASDSPKDPEFEMFDRFPLTQNDDETTARVGEAFAAYFGEQCRQMPQQSASEDFSEIPVALGAPYTYWGIGGIDPATYRQAAERGRVDQDIPVNHSSTFAPVIQPTLDTGTKALVVAATAWLTPASGKPVP
ncbi:amidohydrolase [Mycolicibacterium holsaticum]|uniref:Amidohydrolase n=1 Tax=Mycolicibacterium holsaticum TaxID=152142 RepID=A0A1E3R6I4_9MYCO|nr:amidohydrolase [Mycolicibacterium holsaticum]ODQ85535.1 amidohydrolase [Mycolicibacterium holsaticum]